MKSKPLRPNVGLSNIKTKSQQSVPSKKGTDSKHFTRCIQGNDGFNRQRSIAPCKTGGINQQNARPQQAASHARSSTVKSSNKIVNTNIKCNSTKVQNCECVYSKRASTSSAKSNKNVFQHHGRSNISRIQNSIVVAKQISSVPPKRVTSDNVKAKWVKKVLPSENHKNSKDSPVQKVQKQIISVKRKSFNQQIWKPKASSLSAIANPQKKHVLVEVTYKDAQGMPRTCMSCVPVFN